MKSLEPTRSVHIKCSIVSVKFAKQMRNEINEVEPSVAVYANDLTPTHSFDTVALDVKECCCCCNNSIRLEHFKIGFLARLYMTIWWNVCS